MSVMDVFLAPELTPSTHTMGSARAALEHARSHDRPKALAEFHGMLAPHLWIRLVGEFWTRCDGDRHALSVLIRAFEGWDHLMNAPRERVLWSGLPEQLVLWRGCYRGLNEDGLSYSVDVEGARQYPLLGRFRRNDAEAVLIRAVVERSQCAVKVDSGVMEVLVRKVSSKRTYPLSAEMPVDRYDIMAPAKPRRCWPGVCLRVAC